MNYRFTRNTKKEKTFADVVAGEVFYDSADSGECFMKLHETLYSSDGQDNYNAVDIGTGGPTYFFESEVVVELKVTCTVEVVPEGN